MRKIPTLFVRDPDERRYVLDDVTPGCEWVLAGEGAPTRKYDGTCVMFDGSDWWARREVKPGKSTPDGFVVMDHDEVTGKTVGWEPVGQSSFAKFHTEALTVEPPAPLDDSGWEAGTYELVGPKINQNPERRQAHTLIRHAYAPTYQIEPRTYGQIREAVRSLNRGDGCEGVVFHHPDGRMAKIKARDFR